MGVATTLWLVPVLLGVSVDVAAEQPPLPIAPDACHPIQPGDSLVETRILSFEQPRYSCDPYNSTTQGWKEELVGRDPQHVPLQPTAKKGCILAETRLVGLDDRALDNLPIYNQTPAQIELRVDGVPRRVPYAMKWGCLSRRCSRERDAHPRSSRVRTDPTHRTNTVDRRHSPPR